MLCVWCTNSLTSGAAACPKCGVSATLSSDEGFREGLRSLQVVAERPWHRHPLRWIAGAALVAASAAALVATSPETRTVDLVKALAVLVLPSFFVASALLSKFDRDARLARAALARLRNEAGVPLERCGACAGSGRRRAASPIAVAARDVDPEDNKYVSDPTDYKGVAACVPCHGTGVVPRRAATVA
ncbi:MAG TPA: hypothetical protein VKE69_04060 [Planctomycetota bacterium]|nr:hypothetical protein [Planctomycetota bacterium]